VVQEAVAELLALGSCIRAMAPCKVTLNIPPPDEINQSVLVEIYAKLNQDKMDKLKTT